MIVPDYWVEARKQHRAGGKQITVRRFGWSTTSESDALAMAEQRAAEALARIVSGERLERLESKRAYNGAFGVPIREEVLSRHGLEVVTRNAYGAHCLNTPRALFADIDFSAPKSTRLTLVLFAFLAAISIVGGSQFWGWGIAVSMLVISLLAASPISAAAYRLVAAVRGGPERIARRRIVNFVSAHPAWNLRLYKTPGGMRLLATHQTFEASAPEVREFFEAVGADPVYVRMCTNQQCFRARLTAKPWRIGMRQRMRPRPGVWPVHPDRLQVRQEWIAKYEQASARFAACHFVESLGSGKVHEEILGIVELHDHQARANNFTLAMA